MRFKKKRGLVQARRQSKKITVRRKKSVGVSKMKVGGGTGHVGASHYQASSIDCVSCKRFKVDRREETRGELCLGKTMRSRGA